VKEILYFLEDDLKMGLKVSQLELSPILRRSFDLFAVDVEEVRLRLRAEGKKYLMISVTECYFLLLAT
jgi:hypothetical protein